MRISILAIAIPTVLAISIDKTDNALEKSEGIVGYLRNMWMSKRAKIHRFHKQNIMLEDIDEIIAAQIGEKSSQSIAAVSSVSEQWIPVSYSVQVQGGNYIYRAANNQEVNPHTLDIQLDSDYVQAVSKVEISSGNIYISQTDSYTIPDLSSYPPDSPFVKDFPDFTDRGGLFVEPKESSSV